MRKKMRRTIKMMSRDKVIHRRTKMRKKENEETQREK